MSFDLKVPDELKDTQKWFASIITRPIDQDNNIMPVSPTGNSIEEESKQYIVPSKGLKEYERIQIYNQQYWWRLLTIMHENFPLVTRLFGYYNFNQQIGFPYLEKYPPNHWSLNYLGNLLSDFLNENYLNDDKELVFDAAEIDYCYSLSFFAEKKEAIDFNKEAEKNLSTLKLTLQPHVFLFKLNYDLFSFRYQMLQESPDHWIENEFPVLEKGNYCFIVYRNKQNFVVSEIISEVAYQILEKFKSAGASIDDVCEWLETEDDEVSNEAMLNMQKWFQDWAALELLVKCNLK